MDALQALKQRLRRQRVFTELLQTAHFEITHRGGPPVIVHQMARVGSITVLRALRARLPRRRVYHTHYLNPATIRERHEQFRHAHRVTGEAPLHREYLAARALQRRLRRRGCGQWKVISLVRDPLERTASAFFRHFPYNHPELGPRYHEDLAHTDDLIERFLDPDEQERRFALNWFDREIRDVLGVDVFEVPFPHERGYATYAGPCELLVLRLEDLDRIGAHAIGRFVGLDGLSLGWENRSCEKPYFPAYTRFRAELRVPAQLLDAVYGSRVARHFYTEEELGAFRARWAGDRLP